MALLLFLSFGEMGPGSEVSYSLHRGVGRISARELPMRGALVEPRPQRHGFEDCAPCMLASNAQGKTTPVACLYSHILGMVVKNVA